MGIKTYLNQQNEILQVNLGKHRDLTKEEKGFNINFTSFHQQHFVSPTKPVVV
jgi:hypothetical protein